MDSSVHPQGMRGIRGVPRRLAQPPRTLRGLYDLWRSAVCRITVIAAEGIKPGAHASVAQNTLTLDDLLDS